MTIRILPFSLPQKPPLHVSDVIYKMDALDWSIVCVSSVRVIISNYISFANVMSYFQRGLLQIIMEQTMYRLRWMITSGVLHQISPCRLAESSEKN